MKPVLRRQVEVVREIFGDEKRVLLLLSAVLAVDPKAKPSAEANMLNTMKGSSDRLVQESPCASSSMAKFNLIGYLRSNDVTADFKALESKS